MSGILEFGKIVNSSRVGSDTGVVTWDLNIDAEGHREYTIIFRVKVDKTDGWYGPGTAASAAGLPSIGAAWRTDLWNLGNEVDFFARATPYTKVTPYAQRDGEPFEYYNVEVKFSTRPRWRCQDAKVDEPINEPQKVSGSFVKKTKEAKEDKDGDPILSSSFEPVRGPAVEFDENYPTVTIEQNVQFLELPLVAALARRTVNREAMWGLPARTVRLATASWSRQVVNTCDYFYTRTFEFEIDYDTFDRDDIQDEGTKALGRRNPTTGAWESVGGDDASDPRTFNRYVDTKGEIAHVLLDSHGYPMTGTADFAPIPIIDQKGTLAYYYDQINFGGNTINVDYINLLHIPYAF